MITYSDWQKIRREAQDREVKERGEDLQHARPPLQVAVTDQILRDLIERVQRLEVLAQASAGPIIRNK